MTRRDIVVVLLLGLAAVASVPLAVVLDSTIPLFCAWLAQLGILVYLSLRDRARSTAVDGPPPDSAAEGASGR